MPSYKALRMASKAKTRANPKPKNNTIIGQFVMTSPLQASSAPSQKDLKRVRRRICPSSAGAVRTLV